MAETFRTTISAVFWTETTDAAQTIASEINAAVPEQDQPHTLVTIEFKPDGRPVTAVPEEAATEA